MDTSIKPKSEKNFDEKVDTCVIRNKNHEL